MQYRNRKHHGMEIITRRIMSTELAPSFTTTGKVSVVSSHPAMSRQKKTKCFNKNARLMVVPSRVKDDLTILYREDYYC